MGYLELDSVGGEETVMLESDSRKSEAAWHFFFALNTVVGACYLHQLGIWNILLIGKMVDGKMESLGQVKNECNDKFGVMKGWRKSVVQSISGVGNPWGSDKSLEDYF